MLIVTFMNALLFFIPYYVRLGIVSVVIVLYAALCGFDSSVLRAVCMASLSIFALFAGRPLQVQRSIQIVYIGMLLRNPYYLLYDLGFIFSFSALVGLVFFTSRRGASTTKKKKLSSVPARFWNTHVLPSISASLGISAPLLFFTGSVNLSSIVSNLFVIPLVPFVMIYGFFNALLYSVVSAYDFTHILPLLQEWSVQWIYYVNQLGNRHAFTITAVS